MEIIVRVACTLYIEIFPMIFSRKKTGLHPSCQYTAVRTTFYAPVLKRDLHVDKLFTTLVTIDTVAR